MVFSRVDSRGYNWLWRGTDWDVCRDFTDTPQPVAAAKSLLKFRGGGEAGHTESTNGSASTSSMLLRMLAQYGFRCPLRLFQSFSMTKTEAACKRPSTG